MSNFDTNPCDNDLSKMKTFDKLQLRRGDLLDLPQPLKAGELGFAVDYRKLFIGTTCDSVPTGVQIRGGDYSYAQTLIDNSTILVRLSSAYDDTAYRTFRDNIQASYSSITDTYFRYDGDTSILIGLPSGFSDTSGLITLIEAQTDVITPVTIGSGYSVNMVDGTVSLAADVIAGMLSHILNNVAQDNIAQNLLNVEIETTTNKGQANGYTPLDENTLIPTQYLPALSITSVTVVADIPARDNLTVQEGDVAVVTDASADGAVQSGSATYIYDGSSWVLLEVGANLLESDLLTNGGTVLQSGDNVSELTNDAGYITEGLLYWQEDYNTTAPNDTRSAIIFEPLSSLSETNIDIALSPKGNGAITAQIADGTTTGGDKRGTYAVDFQRARDNSLDVASGTYASVLGGENNRASGDHSVVLGGQNNVATDFYGAVLAGQNNICNGQWSWIGGGESNLCDGNDSYIGAGRDNTVDSISRYSFIGAGNNNNVIARWSVICGGGGPLNGEGNTIEANANYSFIGAGERNLITANNEYAVIVGGFDNTVSNDYAFVGGGRENTATGLYSSVIGGHFNDATASYGVASGRRSKSNHAGAFAFSDSQDADNTTTQADEMRLRFQNGVFVNGNEVLDSSDLQSNGGGVLETVGVTNSLATSFTLNDTNYDSGQFFFMTNGTAETITLGAAPQGYQAVVVQTGSGSVDFVADTGETVNSKVGATPSISAQYSAITVIKDTASTWVVLGDVA